LTLRRQATVSLGIALVALVLALNLLCSEILLHGFGRIERTAVQQDVERVRSAVERSIEGLEEKATDWAYWDDSWTFVQNANAAFIESNLDPNALSLLRVDVMLFLDRSREVVHCASIDRISAEAVDPPEELIARFAGASPMVRIESEKSGRSGVIVAGGRPWEFAALPVLTSGQLPPQVGTLVFARRLDAEEMRRIASVTHLDVWSHGIDEPADAELAAELATAKAALEADDDRDGIVIRDEETIAGYGRIADVHGRGELSCEVGAVVQRTVERDRHLRGG